MKNLVFLVSLAFLGCSSPYKNTHRTSSDFDKSTAGTSYISEPDLKSKDFNYDGFLSRLDSTNQKIRGQLYRKMNKDLGKMDRDLYLSTLAAYASSIARNTERDLRKFERITVAGHKKTFIFCAHSTELSLSLCDDPRCMNIENYSYSRFDITEDLRLGLPRTKCGAK